MRNKIVIALFGQARSGKNTVADMISNKLQELQLFSKQLALADPIKKGLACLLNVNVAQLENAKENNFTIRDIDIRKILQVLPTELRKMNDYIFIEILAEEIQNSDEDIIIVTDGRFPIEFDFLKKEFNAYTIKIIRNKILQGEVGQHISETAIDSIENDKFDYIINNNKGLDELRDNIEKVLDNIMQDYRSKHAQISNWYRVLEYQNTI